MSEEFVLRDVVREIECREESLSNALGKEEVSGEVFCHGDLPLDEEFLVFELLREADRLREDVAARV